MILYFTGTGNSRYTAEIINKVTNDEVISINELMKKSNTASFHSNEPFVFVVPTYAWRMPKVVEDFIVNSEFTGSIQAYFILTCGSEIHDAAHYAKKLCDMKKFAFMGCSTVIMPSNYLIMPGVPDETQADSIIEKAIPSIISIGEKIKNHQPLEKQKITALGKIMSKAANPLFYMIYVNDKGFYATNECIGCKKCVTLCPLNNIDMENNKPKWSGNCTHCMACICGCPKTAIEFKNKTKGRNRYYNTREV